MINEESRIWEQNSAVGGYTHLREMESRTAIINALLKLFLRTTSRREFLREALKIIRDWAGSNCAGIRVTDDQGNIPYIAHIGFSDQFIKSENWLSLKKDHCACIRIIQGNFEPQDASAITSSGSFCCNDTSKFLEQLSESQKTSFRGVCVQNGYQSLAIIPIKYNKKILGAIHLADGRTGMFTRNTIEFLDSSIAPLIGEGIYRFNVEAQLERNLETQTALTSLFEMSLKDFNLTELLKMTLDLIHSSRSFSFGTKSAIYLVENEPEIMVMKVSRGFDDNCRQACKRIQFGDCLCGQTAQKQELQFSENIEAGQNKHNPGDTCRKYCIPIQSGKTTLGVIVLYLEGEHRRDHREEEFLNAIANTLAGIVWRKNSEEKLLTLSRRLVRIQEDERRSIALELHDQIGQMLTGLKLMVNQAARSPDGQAGPVLQEAQTTINDLIVKVREMSLNLRPSMLDDLGLLPTILWHFQQRTVQDKLKIDFRHAGLDRAFPKEVSIAAYRIIQEALTNIVRHAGVSEVMVNAWADDTALHLKIEDQGKGFKINESSISNSVGMQGMRERAMLLGGRLTIESAPGVGTTITAELPLQDKVEIPKVS